MNSNSLIIICACIIAAVLAIAGAVVLTHSDNGSDDVLTSDEAVATEMESSEDNSDPLAGMEGTDLYRATHSDLIIVGVVQTSDGNYICYGGSSDGVSWGYTNYDSAGNRLSSYSVGSERQLIEDRYHSFANSAGTRVII